MEDGGRARRKSVNRGFKWVMISSLVLHFGIFGAVVYAQTHKPASRVINSVPVELVRLGKPRDPDLLPRIQRQAPPPPDDAIALDSGKKTQKPKREKKPKMSNAARRMLAGANDDALDNALSKIEAPEGTADGSVEGTTSDPARAARGYVALAAASLRSAYSLPDILKAQQQFLSAEILIFIGSAGQILKYEVVKRHSNDLFMSALERLLKSHELPPPPKELVNRFRTEGILVRFKP